MIQSEFPDGYIYIKKKIYAVQSKISISSNPHLSTLFISYLQNKHQIKQDVPQAQKCTLITQEASVCCHTLNLGGHCV